jgi:hypothetical protein
MHQKSQPQDPPAPLLLLVLPFVIICLSALYWYVTSQLEKQKSLWCRASELKEDFPDIFDEKEGNIEALIYDDRSQLYAAKDITDEDERWCVLTPVNVGKWKICNIWWLALTGLCVTLPLCTILFMVRIRLFVRSNMGGSVVVL